MTIFPALSVTPVVAENCPAYLDWEKVTVLPGVGSPSESVTVAVMVVIEGWYPVPCT